MPAPLSTIDVQPSAVALSEPVFITLRIEGTAPLVVKLPQSLLEPSSAQAWKIEPIGNAERSSLGNSRERWELKLRADPYTPGDAIPLQFVPFSVASGDAIEPVEVTWPARFVAVKTDLTAKSWPPRPLTEIEPAPPLPVSPAGNSDSLIVAISAGVLLSLLATGVCRWLQKRKQKRQMIQQKITREQELQALAEPLPDVEAAAGISAFLRRELARRDATATTALTTQELVVQAKVPPNLQSILEKCDRVKYAGETFPHTERIAQLAVLSDWLAEGAV